VTDPYQPVERRLRLTRGWLEVMAEFRQAVAIVTKNRLVTRDLDLLGKLAPSPGRRRDAQLSRQRLHGVVLIAGLVQNQKTIGIGSVLVVSSTVPSVSRALIAAGTPRFSDFSRPVAARVFQAIDTQFNVLPIPPVLARGVLGRVNSAFLNISQHFTAHLFRPWIPSLARDIDSSRDQKAVKTNFAACHRPSPSP
jgi:hypothetical protein